MPDGGCRATRRGAPRNARSPLPNSHCSSGRTGRMVERPARSRPDRNESVRVRPLSLSSLTVDSLAWLPAPRRALGTDHQAGPLGQRRDRRRQVAHRREGGRRPSNEHEVVAGAEPRVERPDGFAHASLDAVTCHRVADAPPHDEPDPGCSRFGRWSQGTDKQRVRPTPSVGTHPFKVCTSPKPKLAAHRLSP